MCAVRAKCSARIALYTLQAHAAQADLWRQADAREGRLHAKLKRFREFGDAADDIDDDDDTWFDDVLMPIKKIASAMVRLARKYERQTRVARITPNNDAGTQSAYAVEEEPPAGMESR